MEQIKLGNGNQYILATNGIIELGNDMLQVIILASGWDFSTIEKDFDAESNTQRMEVLDDMGEPMDIKKGYTTLKSIKKVKSYTTGQIENSNEEGNVTYEDVKEPVFVMILSRPDLRTQVESLRETVDALVLSELGA